MGKGKSVIDASPIAALEDRAPHESLAIEKPGWWYLVTRRLLRPHLNHVIVHVTDRCNLRCKTCFIDFGRKDLSVEEAEVLARKLGHIPALDIGGGEPFLHRDLPGICRALSFGSVTIPTNGQFKERVVSSVEALLREHPGKVTIALSLDGPREINDAVRGEGAFNRALETYHALRALPGLVLKVNTVLCNRNVTGIVDFARQVRELSPDFHSILLLRGEPLAPHEIQLPPLSLIRETTPALFEVLSTYNFGHTRHSPLRLLKSRYQRYMWEAQLRMLEEKAAPFQCKAPKYNKVVYSNGDTSMCELMPRLGNLLHDEAQTIDEKLRRHLAQHERKNGRCFCTHNCNIGENIMTHAPSIAKVIGGRIS